jgi:ribosomal protein L31
LEGIEKHPFWRGLKNIHFGGIEKHPFWTRLKNIHFGGIEKHPFWRGLKNIHFKGWMGVGWHKVILPKTKRYM